MTMPDYNPPVENTPRTRLLTSLGYREYRLFWLGGAFSNIGMWALIYGRLWLMHDLTNSPFMLGVVTASSLGPVLLLSLWGGVVADRVNRLRLVTVTRGMFAGLALLTGVLIATDLIQPWHLIAISLLTGILLSFDIPSRQAMLPNLVAEHHLVNAIALYSFLSAGSAIIGPGFFAPIVNFWGLEALFLLIGMAYMLTVAMLLMMKPLPQKPSPAKGWLWRGLKEGLGYSKENRIILYLLGLGIVGGLFGMSFETLLPVFADQVLLGGVSRYGWLLLSIGVGGLTGAATLARIGTLNNAARIHLIAGAGLGLSLVVFSQITWFPASIGTLAIVGGFSVMFLTVNNTMVQGVVDEEFRGRVMSLHQLTWGVTAIGGLLMGGIAQASDAPMALMVAGVVTVLGTAAFATSIVRKWCPQRGSNPRSPP